jgi:hypothetical protein
MSEAASGMRERWTVRRFESFEEAEAASRADTAG